MRTAPTSAIHMNRSVAMKRLPPAACCSIARTCRSATSRTSTKLKPSRGTAGIPPSSRSISCSENETSSLSAGPMIAPGLTTARRSSAPASATSFQASRSAIAFDRVYGARFASSPSVQSRSV